MALHTYTIADSDANEMWAQYPAGSGFANSWHCGSDGSGGNYEGAIRFQNVDIPNGETILSAQLNCYVGTKGAGSGDMKYVCKGIDEDNTSEYSSSPMARTSTTASKTSQISLPSAGNYFGIDVTSIVQEIVNRGGWSSGNAMGFQIFNNSSPNDVYFFESYLSPNSNLEVTWDEPSPSASQSPSSSQSPSPSLSPSASPSLSNSPSPSFIEPFTGIKIAKPGKNVLLTDNPSDLIFSSDYGTLKYFDKQTKTLTLPVGDVAITGTIDHNLGYYPYVEVFVKVEGFTNYEYCPFDGNGATTVYGATYKVTTSQIVLYAGGAPFASDTDFDFLVFIYKNNLNL